MSDDGLRLYEAVCAVEAKSALFLTHHALIQEIFVPIRRVSGRCVFWSGADGDVLRDDLHGCGW